MDITLLVTLLGSLVALTFAAEFLVRHSSALALDFGVSPLFVGLTIVGFGTSSPEIAASVSATLRGAPELSVSNLVGSNIFNIGMILGLTAMVFPISVMFDRVKRDLFVAVAVSVMPVLAYLISGPTERVVGVAAIFAMTGYVVYAYRTDTGSTEAENVRALEEVEHTLRVDAPKSPAGRAIAMRLVYIVLSLAVLVGSASLFVDSATEIARFFGVSDRVIGLTIVAGGTSLPELVTSLVAALRKSGDIAVGNVVGSNIFNVLGILGLCMVVGPQTIPASTVLIDVPVMVFFSVALVFMARTEFVISRAEGVFLLLVFLGYNAYILLNGSGGAVGV